MSAQHAADARAAGGRGRAGPAGDCLRGCARPSRPDVDPAPDVAACQTALGATQAAQAKVATAQQKSREGDRHADQVADRGAAQGFSRVVAGVVERLVEPRRRQLDTGTGHASTASFASTTAVSFSSASATGTSSNAPSGSADSSLCDGDGGDARA